ncbi:hypothetical protein V5E97_36490 [Singulisphaera sp. Ch08]|uniref:Uncharacterized protein n=1 Tax=Singulisphaera sp. Ch08 TaxID=3120278 RepID=A0AAU7CFD1_9BACT
MAQIWGRILLGNHIFDKCFVIFLFWNLERRNAVHNPAIAAEANMPQAEVPNAKKKATINPQEKAIHATRAFPAGATKKAEATTKTADNAVLKQKMPGSTARYQGAMHIPEIISSAEQKDSAILSNIIPNNSATYQAAMLTTGINAHRSALYIMLPRLMPGVLPVSLFVGSDSTSPRATNTTIRSPENQPFLNPPEFQYTGQNLLATFSILDSLHAN